MQGDNELLFIADLGKARGCSKNSVVIKSVKKAFFHPFPNLKNQRRTRADTAQTHGPHGRV